MGINHLSACTQVCFCSGNKFVGAHNAGSSTLFYQPLQHCNIIKDRSFPEDVTSCKTLAVEMCRMPVVSLGAMVISQHLNYRML